MNIWKKYKIKAVKLKIYPEYSINFIFINEDKTISRTPKHKIVNALFT
jgi:hypothetical protein